MDIFSYVQRKGIDTVDKSFYRMIALWESWYKGRVRNFTFYKIYSGQGTSIRRQRKSLGMAKKLSEDIADLLLKGFIADQRDLGQVVFDIGCVHEIKLSSLYSL